MPAHGRSSRQPRTAHSTCPAHRAQPTLCTQRIATALQMHSTQPTAHSTQHTAHSTRPTAHSTQHTAHSTRHTAHGQDSEQQHGEQSRAVLPLLLQGAPPSQPSRSFWSRTRPFAPCGGSAPGVA
eukprot:1449507-Rhodomonas_salina.7